MKWVKLGDIIEFKRRKKGVSLKELFQTSERLYLFKKKKDKIYYWGYVERGKNDNDNLKFDYVGIKKTDLVDDDYLHYLLLFLFQ